MSMSEHMLATRAQLECDSKVQELNEWQAFHTQEMREQEARTLSLQQAAAQGQEYYKSAQQKERQSLTQTQELQAQLQAQQAQQEQLRLQLEDAGSSAEQEAELEKMRRSQQMICEGAATEIRQQEQQMQLLEASEQNAQQAAMEAQLERDSETQACQEWQHWHDQQVEQLVWEKDNAARETRQSFKEELHEFRRRDSEVKDLRIRELEAQAARMGQTAGGGYVSGEEAHMEPGQTQAPVGHSEEQHDDSGSEHFDLTGVSDEEAPAAVVSAAVPDYVATAEDDVDQRLAEEIAALGPGILRGNELTRTAGSKYKLGEKKIFLKLIDGNVNVREKGNHVPLAAWLEATLTDAVDAADDIQLGAGPYAEHM